MFSTLRNRFGIPGVISVIALVFALVGGAFAANDLGGSGKGATASAKKSAKGPRGPKGATGPAGPAGAAGPAGPAGPKGDAGANGSNGAAGKDGTVGKDGVSVTATQFEGAGGTCSEGGVEFESTGGPTYACNGSEGSPWTAGGTLPSKTTLTGSWAMSLASTGFPKEFEGWTPISFPIPLASELENNQVVIEPATQPEKCENAEHPGVASASNPEAKPGFLCVYVSKFEDGEGFLLDIAKAGSSVHALGASTTGAALQAVGESETTQAFMTGFGTWAVTAP